MRNQRALAVTCAAIAVLGIAAPVAVADGMGNGNGTTGVAPNTGIVVPNPGVVPNTGVFNGNGNFNGNFNGNGNGNGHGNGNGNYNGNGNFGNDGNFGNGNGNRGNDNFGNGNGNFGNGNNNGNGRGNDNFGNGNNNGRGNDFGNGNGNGNGGFGNGHENGGNGNGNGGHGGGNNDGNLRDITVTPSVLPAGGRLTITVRGCRGGTVSSRAFGSARLNSNGNDNSRAVVTIDRSARPGRYDITVDCGGRTLTRPNAFTVIGGVNGGLGGSSTTGATKADTAIGGGLVASAALGGCVFWLRRRHEKRA
ncbi:hypothetical protein ACGFZR_09195 [Streptomyces sp. NPDC048241]|uniref:hypothetical protein n=1 Tax=Streptomyces sp. NPDC048241 TaxID=3365521 RepID=UPI003723EB10